MTKYRARRWSFISLSAMLVFAASIASGCHAEQTWPLWDQYSARFIDGQGRVIDHSANEKTTSEGQSYALFFALVDNDKTRFAKVLSWTQTNLANGDLTAQLPAWSWGQAPDGSWKILDGNPAADSDLWIAYSLIEAGRLWRDPRYEKMGSAMASLIAQQEVAMVPGVGTTLLAGARGFHPDASTWILNPSYLPLPVLTRFANASPVGPWNAVIASLRPLLRNGSGAGYAMDWVGAGTGVRPIPAPGSKETQAIGSYDAIRVYLWLGISDPATPGRGELLGYVTGMAAYLKSHTVPPEKVDSAGKALNAAGPAGFSAALVPFLDAERMRSEQKVQADRLAGMKDPASGLYGNGPNDLRYYDQNLALFSTGWTDERYRFGSDGRLRVKWNPR